MKLNTKCECGNFRGGEPFTKDQCAVCWGRDNYQRRKGGGVVAAVTQVSAATAAWWKAGSPVRTADELGVCFDICRDCEHYQPTPVARCGQCGCFLAAKARMATETCPLGKWPVSGDRLGLTGGESTPPESPS